MSDIWSNIVTAVATLTAALGTNALGNRATRLSTGNANELSSVRRSLTCCTRLPVGSAQPAPYSSPRWPRPTSTQLREVRLPGQLRRGEPPFGKALIAARLLVWEPAISVQLVNLTLAHGSMPKYVMAVQRSELGADVVAGGRGELAARDQLLAPPGEQFRDLGFGRRDPQRGLLATAGLVHLIDRTLDDHASAWFR
jgi:hypothetical protein